MSLIRRGSPPRIDAGQPRWLHIALRAFCVWVAGSLALATSSSLSCLAAPPSLSVGDATSGRLLGGHAMPMDGSGFRILGKTAKRGFYYGTARLVKAVRQVAKRVHDAIPQSTLGIGNLSRQEGGDIPQSRSHNSGRDADLAFYVLNRKGKPTRPDDFVRFSRNHGIDNGTYLFDLERNWALVRTFLSEPSIGVDWIFVANWLRAPLLEHARAVEADDALILKAETVLKQPGDSAPHDDHFHVRIYCTARERVEAECTNYGWVWPWVHEESSEWTERVAQLIRRASDPGRAPAKRAKALGLLADWRACEALDYAAAWVTEAELHEPLVRLVSRCEAGHAVGALLEATRGGSSLDDAAITRLARATRSPALCAPIAERLAPSTDAARATALLDALSSIDAPCAVEVAAITLDARDASVAEAGRKVVAWHLGAIPRSRGAFEELWSRRSALDSTSRLEAAFADAGTVLGDMSYRARIDALIDSLDESEPMGQNAARLLVAYTGEGRHVVGAKPAKARAFWVSWWKARRSRFDLAAAP